jgi:hypothetical protein
MAAGSPQPAATVVRVGFVKVNVSNSHARRIWQADRDVVQTGMRAVVLTFFSVDCLDEYQSQVRGRVSFRLASTKASATDLLALGSEC